MPLLSEKVGDLRLVQGSSKVSLTSEVAGVTFNRLEHGGSAAIDFDLATGTGNPSPYLRIGFDAAPTLNNSIIGPWATVNNEDFATYDPIVGVKPLGTTVPRPSQVEGASPSSHVLVGGGPALSTLTKDTTVATLAITTEGGRDLNLGGHTLTLRDGGLIRSGGSTVDTRIDNGQLTAGDGSGPATLYVHTNWTPVSPPSNGLVINASIIDNPAGGATSLVLSADLLVTLAGANSYSGPTIVQRGQVKISSDAALPAGNDLTVAGGAVSFDYQSASTKQLSRLALSQRASLFTPSTLGPSDQSAILIEADQYDFQSGRLCASLTGAGPMHKSTEGLVELDNDSPTYAGAITIDGGVLVAGGNRSVRIAPQALGLGETEIRSGGALIHGAASTDGYMYLNAKLHLAGGDVGIISSITTSRWDFDGAWRVTAPSRLLTFDPHGEDDITGAVVNVRGAVTLQDQSKLTVLGDGSVNFLGGVNISGHSELSSPEAPIALSNLAPATGGGTLLLSGAGRFLLPSSLTALPTAPLTLEIAPETLAGMPTSAPSVMSDVHVIVNGRLFTDSPLELLGGELSGTGKLLDVTNDHGDVSPGNSVGTISMRHYVQGPQGTLNSELFGGPSHLSDLIRADAASLAGTIHAILASGAHVHSGDVFNLVVARDITANGLALFPEGFAGRLQVVPLTSGPDAGLQALQLTIVPEPRTIYLIGAMLLFPIASSARRRAIRTSLSL
jgi:autotransporter-associated beta strand protein